MARRLGPIRKALATARIELAAAGGPDDLERSFRRAVRSYGFTTYALGFLPVCVTDEEPEPPRPFLMLDWPKAWLELYAREGFAADDIVVAEAARTREPFTWVDVQARHPGASERIFKAAAEFGWGNGFVVPIHDPTAPPGERLGVASLAAPDLAGFDADQRSAVAALAFTAFGRARAFGAEAAKGASRRDRLSERERDALMLVAEGRSDIDIGAIMGVSRAGAHFHVEQAKKRLGASTRAQAVAIALARGML